MQNLKLRSSIKPELMRRTLFRGTIVAAIGGIVLLYGALFLPTEFLTRWGLPIAVLAGILVTVGLLPYKRLVKLGKQPYELVAIEDKSLQFFSHGRHIFTIPTNSIEKLTYIERKNVYGIGLKLKKPLPEKLSVHDSRYPVERFQTRSRKVFNHDFFFPYFTQRSYDDLINFQKNSEE